MAEVTHNTDDFRFLLEQANAPQIDLSKIFGTAKPMYVSVDDLLPMVAKIEQPAISLHWDGDKTLSVKQLEDGGVMATFEVQF